MSSTKHEYFKQMHQSKSVNSINMSARKMHVEKHVVMLLGMYTQYAILQHSSQECIHIHNHTQNLAHNNNATSQALIWSISATTFAAWFIDIISDIDLHNLYIYVYISGTLQLDRQQTHYLTLYHNGCFLNSLVRVVFLIVHIDVNGAVTEEVRLQL